MSDFVLSKRVEGLATTVFSEFSALALMHKAVNLGQGFPNFDGPEVIKEVALRAIRDGKNQYSPGVGVPELREAIAAHSERFYSMKIDPESMVSVTCGATEALFDALIGLVDIGDEVILSQPFYDSYEASVLMAGGIPRCVTLYPPDERHPFWWFEDDELRQAFTKKTKVLVLNSPHNPTGKVFSKTELEQIASLCLHHNVIVVSDEVYEHLVYSPANHLRIATLPDMADRVLTIGSGGKTFSLTGWKVGWAIGVPELRQAVQRTHQFVTFATAAPFQLAVAQALMLPDSYFADLTAMYSKKKETLRNILIQSGFRPLETQGTYFIMADYSALSSLPDSEFCRLLVEKSGVAAIPPSVFYEAKARLSVPALARFAFCKTDDMLSEAGVRLERFGAASI